MAGGANKAPRPGTGAEARGWAVALVALAFAAMLLPVFARTQAEAVDVAAVALGAAGFAGALAVAFRDTAVGRRTLLPGVVFLAWALTSALLSERGLSAFMGEPTNLVGWFALAAAAAVAMAAAGQSECASRILVMAAPVAVALQAAIVAGQLAMRGVARGTFPNSTYLGEAMVLLLPFVAHQGLSAGSRWRVGLASSGVIALAASGSRVAALAGLTWLLIDVVPRSSGRRVLAAVALLVAVSGAGLLFASGEFRGALTSRAFGDRPLLWETAARATLARPLTGYGPDGFVAGAARVSTVNAARAGRAVVVRPGAVDPHSLVAWTSVSTGFVGLVLLLWLAWAIASAWREPGRPPVARSASWSVAMAVAVSLTAPVTLHVLPLFALALGVSLAPSGICSTIHQRRPWRRFAVAVAGVALAASSMLAVAAAARLPFELHGPSRSPARAASAIRVAQTLRVDPYLWHLASLHAGWAARADPALAAARPDLAAIDRAVALDRRDPFFALERARTLWSYQARESDVDAAFDEVFKRWELFPLARAEHALVLARRGRVEEAREEAEKARLVDDGDPERMAVLAAVGRLLGE